MLKLTHLGIYLFFLPVAILGAADGVSAQALAAEADAAPVVLNVKQAERQILDHSKPEYPPIAKVNYLQGLVTLQLRVDSRGTVIAAHVLEGNALLAASALKVVRHWIYRPVMTPTGPEGFTAEVRVKYSLTTTGIDLTPKRAEQDFLRQVLPPRVIYPTDDAQSSHIVHVRVLVGDDGQIDDVVAPLADGPVLKAALETLRTWRFRPAHWGNLSVASYLDIDVPISGPSLARATLHLPAR